jgi:hypothetical protein
MVIISCFISMGGTVHVGTPQVGLYHILAVKPEVYDKPKQLDHSNKGTSSLDELLVGPQIKQLSSSYCV